MMFGFRSACMRRERTHSTAGGRVCTPTLPFSARWRRRKRRASRGSPGHEGQRRTVPAACPKNGTTATAPGSLPASWRRDWRHKAWRPACSLLGHGWCLAHAERCATMAQLAVGDTSFFSRRPNPPIRASCGFPDDLKREKGRASLIASPDACVRAVRSHPTTRAGGHGYGIRSRASGSTVKRPKTPPSLSLPRVAAPVPPRRRAPRSWLRASSVTMRTRTAPTRCHRVANEFPRGQWMRPPRCRWTTPICLAGAPPSAPSRVRRPRALARSHSRAPPPPARTLVT